MNVRLSIAGLVVALMLAWVPSSFGRWFDAERGQWLSRDQAGYVNGPNLYEYVGGQPIVMQDPTGLVAMACSGAYHEDPPHKLQAFNPCVQCCKQICALTTDVGHTACCDGAVVSCICDHNIPSEFPGVPSSTFDSKFANCIGAHEVQHQDQFSSCPAEGILMEPNNLAINGYCRHLDIYKSDLTCINAIDCSTDSAGKPVSKAVQDACEARKLEQKRATERAIATLEIKCHGGSGMDPAPWPPTPASESDRDKLH